LQLRLRRGGVDGLPSRPLRRLIQNEVEDILSDGILSGEFPLASVVRISVEGEGDDATLKMENVAEQMETTEA